MAQASNRAQLGFLVPAIGLLLVLTIVPIVATGVLSTTSLSYTNPAPTSFVGLENFTRLLDDARMLRAIPVTLVYIAAPVAVQMVLGFVGALVMRERLPGMAWLRLVFVAPMVLPPIVMGLLWRVLFTPQLGGLNYYLSLIGIDGPPWLSDPNWAVVAIVLVAVWGWTPFVALMLVTAMEGVPHELYEAARIDGASWWQTVREITLPQIRSTIYVVAVFRVIEALAIFPIIFVVTGGGPAGATESVNYYAYVAGITQLRVGYAAAIIVVFLVILMAIVTPTTRTLVASLEESTA